jgi:hypothetical protein
LSLRILEDFPRTKPGLQHRRTISRQNRLLRRTHAKSTRRLSPAKAEPAARQAQKPEATEDT